MQVLTDWEIDADDDEAELTDSGIISRSSLKVRKDGAEKCASCQSSEMDRELRISRTVILTRIGDIAANVNCKKRNQSWCGAEMAEFGRGLVSVYILPLSLLPKSVLSTCVLLFPRFCIPSSWLLSIWNTLSFTNLH